jgi:hypothetical protein
MLKPDPEDTGSPEHQFLFSISDLVIVYVYLALLKLILKFRIGKFAATSQT